MPLTHTDPRQQKIRATVSLVLGELPGQLTWMAQEQPTFPRTAAMLRRKRALEAAVRRAEARGHLSW